MIRPLRLCVLVAVLAGTWLGGCGYFLDLVPEEKGLPLVSRPVAEEMLRTLKEREAKATSLPPAGGCCREAGTDSPGDDRLGGADDAGCGQ